MERTGTAEDWEADCTVMVPAQGESEHRHDERMIPTAPSNTTCSGFKDPHLPTKWQIGQVQGPGDGERKSLDLSASTVEIRNQKQHLHHDHS